MPINTTIEGSRLPAGTGSQFGSNLLRGLAMLQQGRQGEKQMAQDEYEFGERMALAKNRETNLNEARVAEDNLKAEKYGAAKSDRDYFKSIAETEVLPGSSEGMESVTTAVRPQRETSTDAFNDTNSIRLREKLLRYVPKSLEGIQTGKYLTDMLDRIDHEKRLTYTKNFYAITELKNIKDPVEWEHYVELGKSETPEGREFLSGIVKRNKGETDASKNKPMSPIGKLMFDFDQRVAEGKDVSAFEVEFEKHNKNSEVEFKETEIGGKKATVISKPGSNAWRVIVHSENNKGDIVKLQSAYRAKDSAQKALLNSRTLRNPEARANAEKYILAADKQIEELSSSLDTPGSVSAPSPEPSSSSNTNEVTRFTETGRPAIFDAKTKKFLRYAN